MHYRNSGSTFPFFIQAHVHKLMQLSNHKPNLKSLLNIPSSVKITEPVSTKIYWRVCRTFVNCCEMKKELRQLTKKATKYRNNQWVRTYMYFIRINLMDSVCMYITDRKFHLFCSKKREAVPDLAPMLWHSFGTVAALLQEIVNIYPAIHPPHLTVIIIWLLCIFLSLIYSMKNKLQHNHTSYTK